MNGLPQKYKLFWLENKVGFEKHTLCEINGILIYHSVSGDDGTWFPVEVGHGEKINDREKWIYHTRKTQFTGFHAKNGEVYFGDKLRDGRGNVFKVVISNGIIEAKIKEFGISNVMGMYMDRLELVK